MAGENPTSADTGNASAPQNYDDKVLQKGTEATSKVSQSNNHERITNSDTLHEKPGPLPSIPLLPTVQDHVGRDRPEVGWRRKARETTQDEEDSTSHQDQSSKATVVVYDATANQESSDSQKSPANSTPPIDLGFPKQDSGGIQLINDGRHPDGKFLEEQSIPEDSHLGRSNAYKKVHYEYIGSQNEKSSDEHNQCHKG